MHEALKTSHRLDGHCRAKVCAVSSYDPQAVITALVKVAREEILTTFAPDSCIASTRIGIDVLRYFGVTAKPIPVSVTIFNEDARRILEEEGIEAVATAVQGRETLDIGGPWTLGLGVSTPNHAPGPGHLAIAIPHHLTIVDLSLDQANRPRKNIALTPVALKVPEEGTFFTQVGEQIVYTVSTTPQADAVSLIYRHESNDRYRTSRNWARSGHEDGAAKSFRLITAAIIHKMRNEMDGK